MTTYQTDDRAYPGYAYPRPNTSSHPEIPSPERVHSAQAFVKGGPPPPSPYQAHHDQPPPPSSSHGYPPQPPITPLSGSNYPPQPPPSTSHTESSTPYYGLTTPTHEQKQIPSPPLSSGGALEPTQFTPDGAPIVPIGVSGGKMFRCRGYGECDKVFTRSEHLARHVRKHTGERPFPCHCGKAFSRLDNLRQHAATVHADQAPLNDAMLTSLAHVHAALSTRASKEQKRRGEIVEVPKNAVERPRNSEQYRTKSSQGPPPLDGSPYAAYAPAEHQFTVPPPPQSRPRTGGYEYAYPENQAPPLPPPDEPGPSRRPASSGYQPYPPVYYDQQPTRPPTASTPLSEAPSQLPYPYRPMSASGRDLPVPVHYAESEPPSSAHGPPPQSPMYPPPPHMQAPPPQWSSPPTSHYPPQAPPSAHYPQEGYPPHYPPPPPPPEHTHYGPPPPGSAASNYTYPPQTPQPPPTPQYYPPPPPQQSYPVGPPHTGHYPPPPPVPTYGPPPPISGPHDPAYSYHAGPQPPPPPPDAYGYGQYDARKRRVDDFEDASRKAPRLSFETQQPPPAPEPRQQEPLWLPPTTERRSSLAISALLGSPQQIPRSRPTTADVPPSGQTTGYSQPPSSGGFTYGAPDSATASTHSMPATPVVSTMEGKGDVKVEGGIREMDQKAKALLSQGR